MSIKKNNRRKKNPWEVRWRTDGHQRSRSFATRKEAEAYESQIRVDKRRGLTFDYSKENLLFKQVAMEFLEKKTYRKELTRVRNTSIINKHLIPQFGELRVREMDIVHIQEGVETWVRDGKKRRTIDRQLAVLSSVMKFALSRRYIPLLPIGNPERPIATKPHRYSMSVDESRALISAIHPVYRPLLSIALVTGMRWGEIAKLKIADLDWSTQTLTITDAKTGAGNRKIKLSQFEMDWINEHLSQTGRTMVQKDEPLFVSHQTDRQTGKVIGQRLNYSNFRSRIFKPAATAVGLPELQIHDLRRSSATMLVDLGIPLKIVQERLGHTDIRLTMNIYAEGTLDAHKNAAEHIASHLRGDSYSALERKIEA